MPDTSIVFQAQFHTQLCLWLLFSDGSGTSVVSFPFEACICVLDQGHYLHRQDSHHSHSHPCLLSGHHAIRLDQTVFRWAPFAHKAGSQGIILLGFPIGTDTTERKIPETILSGTEVRRKRRGESERGDAGKCWRTERCQRTNNRRHGDQRSEVGSQKQPVRRSGIRRVRVLTQHSRDSRVSGQRLRMELNRCE